MNIFRNDLLNGWLKYHNITVTDVINNHTKEELNTPDWFKLYPVTQEQHDEWEKWAINYIATKTKYSKSYIKNHWGFVYLDCAPNIIKE